MSRNVEAWSAGPPHDGELGATEVFKPGQELDSPSRSRSAGSAGSDDLPQASSVVEILPPEGRDTSRGRTVAFAVLERFRVIGVAAMPGPVSVSPEDSCPIDGVLSDIAHPSVGMLPIG